MDQLLSHLQKTFRLYCVRGRADEETDLDARLRASEDELKDEFTKTLSEVRVTWQQFTGEGKPKKE